MSMVKLRQSQSGAGDNDLFLGNAQYLARTRPMTFGMGYGDVGVSWAFAGWRR